MPGDQPPLIPLTASLIRTAFEEAAQWLVAVVGNVRAEQWNQPGLGVWTVRELTGHATRALITVETYLDIPTTSIDLHSPQEYFRAALGTDPQTHDGIAERGRQAGAALGDEPAVKVWRTADRVLNRLATTPDDAPCASPAGGIQLIDYLTGRVVELTVHTLDLARATRQPLEAPQSAWLVTVTVLLALADPARAVFALTGRDHYNVLS